MIDLGFTEEVFSLKPHQLTGAGEMLYFEYEASNSGILADDMGLDMTMQVMASTCASLEKVANRAAQQNHSYCREMIPRHSKNVRDKYGCKPFKATCNMFKHPEATISNTNKVALTGLKQKLQIIQAFAIHILTRRLYRVPTGCLLAAEMSFGNVNYSTDEL